MSGEPQPRRDGERGSSGPAPVDLERPATAPLVSVIIPVWNVEPYLRACLDSVVGQSIGLGRIEVIAVDDGSTDASGAVLDAYASRHASLRAFHQANSGGPGQPRNVGLDHATGRYVFFLDGDDYLGLEALERMVAMAERNRSDIVLGRLVPVGSRARRHDAVLFAHDMDRADPALVHRSGNVLKLFRRTLFERTGVRFAVGRAGGEDGDVMARLYPAAGTISIVGRYDCYFARGRPDSQMTRHDRTDDLTTAIERIETERILAITTRHRPGWRRDIYVVKHLRSMLRLFGHRWVRLDPDEQRRMFDTGAAVLGRWETARIERVLPAWARLRAECLRHDRFAELVDIVGRPPSEAFGDPVVDGRRLYARYPHFRDASGTPDRCFEFAHEVAVVQQLDDVTLDHGRVTLRGIAYLTLVGGAASIDLHRWPNGARVPMTMTTWPTPEVRDANRRYPDGRVRR